MINSLTLKSKQYNFYFFILFCFLSFMESCTYNVKLVGTYDEVTDNTVTSLYKKTALFFTNLKNTSIIDVSYETNSIFYDDVFSDISILIIRAQISEKGLGYKPLTKNFEELKIQYQEFMGLDNNSINDLIIISSEKAFDQSFKAIMENILYLKWSKSNNRTK